MGPVPVPGIAQSICVAVCFAKQRLARETNQEYATVIQRLVLSCFALLVVTTTLEASAEPSSAEDGPKAKAVVEAARLAQLLDDYFEERLQRAPLLATLIGDPRYNALLPNDLSEEAQIDAEHFERRWLNQIRKIDRELLSGQDQLSYDVFVYEREMALAGSQFRSHLLPINQMFSLPSFFALLGSGENMQPFNTERDYRDFLLRIDRIEVVLDQAIANMRQGISRGIVQPRVVMEKVLPQISAHVVDDVTESVFYKPIENFPESVGKEVRDELAQAYSVSIRDKIVPSYSRLHSFIRDQYMPACRETTSWSDLPDGRAWYAYQIRAMTTTELEPDQIYQYGVQEVARIHREMREVMAKVGFRGDLQDFFEHLKQQDEFYFTDKEELLQGYRDLRTRINRVLPRFFDIFPKADYEVTEVPAYMARSSAGAFYQPGTADGSRPGLFYVNTFNLRAQPKFGMTTLSLHEASPGHHFQVSIAQEIEELPRFRRFSHQSAYVEGWALYVESIGKEMGLLDDPYDYYGSLSDELLRAMRLVVDTGLHAKGWSRENAIEYMLANSSMARSDVIAEVERYIVIPGQALAYKVGQRVFSTLRADAEAALGEDFDLKAFHRAVLVGGALPMKVLEKKVQNWIESEKQ